MEKDIDKIDILDMSCGPKHMWFKKERKDTLFIDIRSGIQNDNIRINPDIKISWINLPFPNNRFELVVWDPPHVYSCGENSWLANKYGRLFPSWMDDIQKGFEEAFRVLRYKGILIFKWSEKDIKLNTILELTNYEPLFGHKTGGLNNTIWVTFMKDNYNKKKHWQSINN